MGHCKTLQRLSVNRPWRRNRIRSLRSLLSVPVAFNGSDEKSAHSPFLYIREEILAESFQLLHVRNVDSDEVGRHVVEWPCIVHDLLFKTVTKRNFHV